MPQLTSEGSYENQSWLVSRVLCKEKRVKEPCLIWQSLSLEFNPNELKIYVPMKTCAHIGNHETADIWK